MAKTFLIITHVVHKRNSLNRIGGYSPYVREMNIWLKYVDKVIVIAPLIKQELDAIEIPYDHSNIEFRNVPQFNFTTIKEFLRSFYNIPLICLVIGKAIIDSDHIHLRCPGNMGLLGCIIQMFYPFKKKTAKYAGNWDWKSKQPFSYNLQKYLLRNTLLTHNMTVLVYGNWPDKNRNILPFYTASYSLNEFEETDGKFPLINGTNLIFVGRLHKGKNPMLALDVCHKLKQNGINVKLTFCGDGPERNNIQEKIKEYRLEDSVVILGNISSEQLKLEYKNSHFLIFISESEGWPKVVAEAMWWGCLPIASKVSCIPEMLGNGLRGELMDNNLEQICKKIQYYIHNSEEYSDKGLKSALWAQKFTLERFSEDIKSLL